LDVRGLYQFLATQAAEAGADIFPSTSVAHAILQDNKPLGLAVRQHGYFFAPLLVDATGVSGVLAQQMNLRGPLTRYGLGAEYDFFWPAWPQDTVAFLFGSLAPQGYGWIFPHGDSRVRIGIGVIHPDTNAEPRHLLNRILTQKEIAGYPVASHAALEFHFGTIPVTPPLQKTFAAGLMVVGDAGGLLSTLLGEGIRFALDVGRMAGETAVAAHHAKRFDADFLARFDERWRRAYGKLFRRGFELNNRLTQYNDDAWNEKIKLLAGLPAEVIPALLQGEFPAPLWWRFRKKLGRAMLQYLYKHI
jgi:digeranylgeranylglycerophospholipid reductase